MNTTLLKKNIKTAIFMSLLNGIPCFASAQKPAFKALVLTERGGQHEGFVKQALDWLKAYSYEKMKARNVYFLMGHDGSLIANKEFTTMFSNALMWAAKGELFNLI